jgi:hypothetical protein
VRMLPWLHMDLFDLLHGGDFRTVIDKTTRYTTAELLHCKSDVTAAVCHTLTCYNEHTHLVAQCVRYDRGGEHMSGDLLRLYEERGIQRFPLNAGTHTGV